MVGHGASWSGVAAPRSPRKNAKIITEFAQGAPGNGVSQGIVSQKLVPCFRIKGGPSAAGAKLVGWRGAGACHGGVAPACQPHKNPDSATRSKNLPMMHAPAPWPLKGKRGTNCGEIRAGAGAWAGVWRGQGHVWACLECPAPGHGVAWRGVWQGRLVGVPRNAAMGHGRAAKWILGHMPYNARKCPAIGHWHFRHGVYRQCPNARPAPSWCLDATMPLPSRVPVRVPVGTRNPLGWPQRVSLRTQGRQSYAQDCRRV